MRKAGLVVGWASTVLVWLVLLFGSVAAWQGADTLPKVNSVLAFCVCLWLLWGMTREKYRAWRGMLQLAAFWVVFHLFKPIREFWIQRVFDAELLAIDRALWGMSLPEYCMRLENYWLTELVSFGYAQYYPMIIFSAVWFLWKRHSSEAYRFFIGLSMMHLFGFLGYLLVPAGGPYIAFPEAFPYPPEGGPITGFLVNVITVGITGMDVFPSLHTGMCLYILGFFVTGYLNFKTRAYLAVSIVVGLIYAPLQLATVYLRYHYGIDLIAGALLAAAVLFYVRLRLGR